MSRKLLMVIAIVWAVLLGGAYAVALAVPAFTSTILKTERANADADTYTWDGSPILIERTGQSRHTVSCDVVPTNGEPRTLKVQGYTKRTPEVFTSWFSGSAEMTCSGTKDAKVYSGISKDIYLFSKNRVYSFIAVVIAFGPLVGVWAFVPKTRAGR